MTFQIKLRGQELISERPVLGAEAKKSVFVSIDATPDWDGLAIRLTFRNINALGMVAREVTVTDRSKVEVPEECMVDGFLFINAVGVTDGGKVRLTTANMTVGIKVYACDGIGAPAATPIPPDQYDQIMALIGDLSSVNVADKTSVAAIMNLMTARIAEVADTLDKVAGDMPTYRQIGDPHEFNGYLANIMKDGVYAIDDSEYCLEEYAHDWNDRPLGSSDEFVLIVSRCDASTILQIAIPKNYGEYFTRFISTADVDEFGNSIVERDWASIHESILDRLIDIEENYVTLDVLHKIEERLRDMAQFTILALGDSLCAGDRNNGKGFVGDLGMKYHNYGVNGATLGENNLMWAGVLHPQYGLNIIRNQLTQAVEDGVTADIIIADGCINDYARNTEIGDVPDLMATSEDYFDAEKLNTTIGGLEKLCFDMWRFYPKARKFFVIPHRLNKVTVYRATESVDYMTTDNEIGYTLTRYYDAVKATCSLYGITVIDVCNESGIDMTDPQYNPGYSWQANSDNPNRDFETSQIWLDQDSHPFEYGYIHGYLPLIHKALFGVDSKQIDVTSDSNFFVAINYNGENYTLDGIDGNDIAAAFNDGKHLVARVNYNGMFYFAPLAQRTKINEVFVKYDFTNAYASNPSGRGFYSVLTNGSTATVTWVSTGEVAAKNVSCNVTVNGETKTNVADALGALAVGGGGAFNLPLLYETTTTEEIGFIDTGDVFEAKNMLIVELISKATTTNTANNPGSVSMRGDGLNPSYPYSNYAIAKSVKEMLSMQYDRRFVSISIKGNTGCWNTIHFIRTTVNVSDATPLIQASAQTSNITGIIIGDASAQAGTRMLGVGTTLRIWGC